MSPILKISDFRDLRPNNKIWRDGIIATDPTFFERSAKDQKPSTLWIGCVDSRVPESVITGSLPGSILTHRNIANQVQPDDLNALSIIEFAVDVLRVQNVVVVGHTGCGGVRASMDPKHSDSPIHRWLRPLAALANYLGVTGQNSNPASVLRLVEANVRMQIANLETMETIKTARSQNRLAIHGWVYHLETGRLEDLRATPLSGEENTTK